jgi:hypothetical protein
MILHEIVQTLERLEQGQKKILEQLGKAPAQDEWVQRGIDSILGYQVGGKGRSEHGTEN